MIFAWFCLQLNDIDLHGYYSKLDPQTPTDEESSKRPVIISLRNATFRYHRIDQRDSDDTNDDNRNFSIGPITGDIKKVKHLLYLHFRSFVLLIEPLSFLPAIFGMLQGDLVCIEGPVGGGKTALLNVINGSLSRMAGFIFFQQIDDGNAKQTHFYQCN